MKRGLPAAVALVVAANIVVLARVAYNRSRVVERIELTEFELGQNYAGTDNSGNIKLTSAVQITNNPQVAFTYLGGASTSGVYNVRNAVNNTVQTVTVTASGRITIP